MLRFTVDRLVKKFHREADETLDVQKVQTVPFDMLRA
jgi:hypothetical protein